MTDDRLQRWLDGALQDDEAAAFLASLPEPAQREARALARLAAAARALPRPAPSPDFTARAMARVRSRRAPRRSLLAALRRPLLSPLAALAGALLLAAAGFGAGVLLRPAPAIAPALAARGPAAAAPQGRVLARLTLRAPGARTVAVAADWNGWDPQATPMHRGSNGVWTLEVPLEPGRRYEYQFVVDGAWRADPQAPAVVSDGFGGENAVLAL